MDIIKHPITPKYARKKRKSYFDGSLREQVKINVITWFFSIITLGFAWPALWCYNRRWHYKHTCIEGYRLVFTGTPRQLFKKHLLWSLLTVITLGAYGFIRENELTKWEINHVEVSCLELEL